MTENRINDTSEKYPTIAEQLEALSPSPKLARLLEEINGNSAISEMLKQQETAAARIREQFAASLSFQPTYLNALSEIAESISKTTTELARAAEFSRASAGLKEAIGAAERWQIQVPRFEFPALPELNFPAFTEIDWSAAVQSMKAGVIRMADRGWTTLAG
jgi:hypothetical protein